MKVSYCTKYGPPEVIEIRDIQKPRPKDNELLINIKASTLNSGDVRVRGLQAKGFMKFLMRLLVGWNKPKNPILGVTFSGVVEEIGKNVKQFKAGDHVFGLTAFKFGCHAEFTTVSEKSMVLPMPKNANFEEAVSILFGGQTAISFLKKMNIETRKNARVLILGGSGSVGTSTIQIAKYFGAHVTTVSSLSNSDLCTSLGADKVIAYDQEDFQKPNEGFDIILDAVGKYPKNLCKHLLNPKGIYKTVGGMEYASESIDQLELISKIYSEGKLKPVIDRIFNFDDIVEAHRYVDTNRKRGNVVIKI